MVGTSNESVPEMASDLLFLPSDREAPIFIKVYHSLSRCFIDNPL
jgi:hypothetical protein